MAKKRQRKVSESSDSCSDSDQENSKQAKLEDLDDEEVKDELPRKEKWRNRQRVLVFGCRGLSFRDRHLVNFLLLF